MSLSFRRVTYQITSISTLGRANRMEELSLVAFLFRITFRSQVISIAKLTGKTRLFSMERISPHAVALWRLVTRLVLSISKYKSVGQSSEAPMSRLWWQALRVKAFMAKEASPARLPHLWKYHGPRQASDSPQSHTLMAILVLHLQPHRISLRRQARTIHKLYAFTTVHVRSSPIEL